MDRTLKSTAERYIPFLEACVRNFTGAGYKPFFLIHGGKEDEALAHEAIERLKWSVPIITEDDPLSVKGIIGACKAVVSSRYHGLINALSQGVPAIGTGWSHKYQALFDDYDAPEFLISLDSPEEEIDGSLKSFIQHREEMREKLAQHAAQHKQLTIEMWEDVLKVLTTEDMLQRPDAKD